MLIAAACAMLSVSSARAQTPPPIAITSGPGWTAVCRGTWQLPTPEQPAGDITWSCDFTFDAAGGAFGDFPGLDWGGSLVDSSSVATNVEEDLSDCGESAAMTSRPVLVASGVKFLPVSDFAVGSQSPLALSRIYNSSNSAVGSFGPRWGSSIDVGMTFVKDQSSCSSKLSGPTSCDTSPAGLTEVRVRLPGGGSVTLQGPVNSEWTDSEGSFVLSQSGATWSLWQESGTITTFNAQGQPVSVRNESGIGWNFTYSAGSVLQSITHTNGRAMWFAWSGDRISAVTAPDGKLYQYAYNGSGMLSSATYPDGLGVTTYHYESALPWALTGYSVGGVRQTRYAYYSNGKVSESGLEGGLEKSTFSYSANYTDVTNALGQVTRHHRNEAGLITQVDRPASAACAAGTTTSVYNGDGRVIQSSDGSGNKTTYAYTTSGRMRERVQGIAPDGSTDKQQITTLVWNAAQTKLMGIREYGATTSDFIRETVFDYYSDDDAGGRARLLKSETVFDRSPTAAPARSTAYDYWFHPNKQIFKLFMDGPLPGSADVTTQEYSSYGDLAKVTNPLGDATTLGDFTAAGRPGRVTDANGLVTTLLYDGKGRVTGTTVEAAGGSRVTSFTYDANDNVRTATDSSGRVTEFMYNFAGQRTQVKAPAAHPLGDNPQVVRNLSYNALGQPNGVSTLQGYLELRVIGWQQGEPIERWVSTSQTYTRRQWAYDAGGFLSNSLGNNGQDIKYAYNASGDLASVTDSLNQTTTTLYDTHGRVKSLTAPSQGTAYFEYGPLGWLTKVTDRNGNATYYTYNGHGDVVRVTSPDSGITQYGYDAAGRVASMTRADGTVTAYARDVLGRVIAETVPWADYNGIPGMQFHTLTYDGCPMGKGRLCSVTDSTGSTNYAYLKTGELASQTSVIDGISFGLEFTYDAYGRLSTASYPNGVVLRYSYTIDHRVQRIEARIAGVWKDVVNNAAYQPFGGPLVGYVHGNGWNRQINYDLDGRVTKIYGSGTTHPQNMVYGYNTNDQITGITNTKNAGATQGYGYNAIGAVTSASAPSTGEHAWQYDANGNRLSHAWGSGTDIYASVPGSNRLASLAGPRPRSATYDPNGNLRYESRGGVTVERRYNGLNRQVKLIRPSAQTLAQPNGTTLSLPEGTWDYGYNALGQRATKSQLGGTTSRYLFSPRSLLLGEANPGSTSLDTIYVWLEGKPVGVIRGNQVYAVHSDHLGRPEVVTNAAKVVVWRATNLAFDRNVTTDTFGGLGIGFPGQQYDAESATWYNVFRDYDASVGRYTRTDPVGLKGGLNGFAYGSNNPITRVDPLGLKDYTQCETEVLLMISAQYATDGYGGVRPTAMAIVNHGFLMDFATNEPSSTFNVRGTEYNAAQFGNFAAGYAGAYYNRYVGESLVMAAGITYNVAEGIVTAITGGGGSGRTIDGDAGSRPYISAGFDTGISDRDSGRPDVCGCER